MPISRKSKSKTMIPVSSVRRAMPALLAGMALLLFSCRPQLPLTTPQKAAEKPFLITKAESYEKLGQTDAALSTYERYLSEHPGGAYAALSMHRLARLYSRQQGYEKAAEIYRRLLASTPQYPAAAEVRYELSRVLYLKGDYQSSQEELLQWLSMYPSHGLRPQVLLLLAENARALADLPEAFTRYLQAEDAFQGDAESMEQARAKALEAINGADHAQLERMRRSTTERNYLEKIQHRMAELYFQDHDLEKAADLARVLAAESHDPKTAEDAKNLLAKIESARRVKPYLIGCVLPLSGPYSLYGQEVLNGMQLALGIFAPSEPDAPFELVIRDSGAGPKEALVGLEQLVHDERVLAVIGPLASKTASAVAARAQELQIPIITLTQKEDIPDLGDWVFRNMSTPRQEVETLIAKAFSDLGLRRFAVLYPDNPYGRTLSELFWEQVNLNGGEVSVMESYRPGQTDFSEQILKLGGVAAPKTRSGADKNTRPTLHFEAVFIPDNAQSVAMITPQLVYHNISEVQLLGTSLWQSPQLISLAADYIQGSVFPAGFFAADARPRTQAFVSSYQETFMKAPDLLAATGYDTIMLLSEVLRQRSVQNRDDLRRALLEVRDFDGVTGKTAFRQNGEVDKAPFLLTIQGDRAVLLP